MTQSLIVIGAGHAAGQAVVSLRAGGWDGRIVVVGEESHVPYERPPLSKQYLAGEMELERVFFRPPAFYDDAEVELRRGRRAVRLDREARTVTLDDGRALRYDRLLLATGSRPRRLELPGAGLDGVCYLRTIDDVDALRRRFAPGRRLAVVGGGYIGLEVAAVAVEKGLDVTVLEMAPSLMARVVAPAVAGFFAALHRRHGVDVRTGARVEGFAGTDAVEAVLCAGGERLAADLVLVCVGVVPNVELARDAGLPCAGDGEGGGVRVDENARTADPRVYAAGDCTSHPNALVGRRVRLESVHNAVEQAKTAAAALCGTPRPYEQVPWFWSDQYDVKLQIAGLSAGHDQVVLRGDPAAGSFAACYLRGGALIALDAISSPRDFMGSRRPIAARAKIPPERLADAGVAWKDMT